MKWRADPWTRGCYQYQDQGGIKKTSTVTHSNAYAWGQEYEAENEEAWDSHFTKDLSSHLLELEGKGKGKALTKESQPQREGAKAKPEDSLNWLWKMVTPMGMMTMMIRQRTRSGPHA